MGSVVNVKIVPTRRSQTHIIVFIAGNFSLHRSASTPFLLFDFQKPLLRTRILFRNS